MQELNVQELVQVNGGVRGNFEGTANTLVDSDICL